MPTLTLRALALLGLCLTALSNAWAYSVTWPLDTPEPSPPLRHEMPENLGHLLVLVLVVIILSLLWNWRLQRQVRQRQAAQAQLSDQLAFQFSLLNGQPTPLYVRDLQGRLSSCNRAYEQFFASSQEEMHGTTPRQQGMCRALADALEGGMLEVLESRQPRFFDSCTEEAGERRHLYQWQVPFYSARGKLLGVLGGWIDISDRKELETRLRDAQRQALDASAAKGRFLATMSHELRTPLNALVGLLELESRARPESSNLRIARQSADAMIDLVGDILDLDRIENGRMQLAPRPVELAALLQECLELFAARAREKGLALQLDCPLPAHRLYRVDPLRLRQVLHNLLANAIKFTGAGSVRLQGHLRDTTPGSSLLTLYVVDDGIGIPHSVQARIFEPYRQGCAEVTQLHGGSGLGLHICRQLVQLMGGRIGLDSEPGQGCRITLELPLDWRPAPSGQHRPASRPAGEHSPRLRVLVVDDLSINALVLQQQLHSLGHSAQVLTDAREALATWAADDFDLLITDCNMPDMDGYQLTRAVREREREIGRARQRIIGYSASALAGEAERCREAGMDELLVKPVTLARLEAALAGGDPVAVQAQSPAPAFDLGHLEGLDPTLAKRLLGELARNLEDELQRLATPLSPERQDLIGQCVHRLSGLACTVDATGLLRACNALRQAGDDAPRLLRCQALLVAELQRMLGEVRERNAA
ncbi:ATP-binding protein [Aquipseudomonas alcaligenes]